MRKRIIYFFSLLLILVFLFFFSQNRTSKNQILKVKIDFKYENGKFLDSQMVNKLLIQSKGSTFFLKEDILDLKVAEDLLKSNPMIASADIFRTPQGILNVKVEERKPVVRIINDKEEFYVDNFGYRVPTSKKYSARVPIYYGQTNKNLKDIVNFIKFIKNDQFAKVEIIDLRNLNNNYILGLRSFPFKIIWGTNSENQHKIKKLKYLYRYLENQDFLKVEKVNLSFDKQIVLDYGQNRK